MKKFILFLFLICMVSNVSAYTLSKKDQLMVNKVNKVLWELESHYDIEWFGENAQLLFDITQKPSLNPRTKEILIQIANTFDTIANHKIQQATNNLIEDENPINTSSFEQDFFETHGGHITNNLTVPEKCLIHYDLLDQIAQEEDFPTPLIIALWGKETNCNMSNPANGWGLFQITSQYFVPGNVGTIELESQVRNVIAFVRNKWDYYNNNTYHNYKQRFGLERIDIHYDSYTLEELQMTAILYNGVSSTTTLTSNSFANANLTPSVTSNSDGIVTRFLKVLYTQYVK